MLKPLLAMMILAPILLTACASTPKPSIEIQRVEIPVIAPCVPQDVKAGRRTSYPDDGVESDPDPASRYQRIATANELRKGRLAVVEPVIRDCP